MSFDEHVDEHQKHFVEHLDYLRAAQAHPDSFMNAMRKEMDDRIRTVDTEPFPTLKYITTKWHEADVYSQITGRITPIEEESTMNDFDVVEVTVPLTWREIDLIHHNGMADKRLALLLRQALPQKLTILPGDRVHFDDAIPAREIVRVLADDETGRAVGYVYRACGELTTIPARRMEQSIRNGTYILIPQEDDA